MNTKKHDDDVLSVWLLNKLEREWISCVYDEIGINLCSLFDIDYSLVANAVHCMNASEVSLIADIMLE